MNNEKKLNLLDAQSYIISSTPKTGKFTFLSYMIMTLFKEKALLFTAQEEYLFQRRINTLSKQYEQFHDLDKMFSPFFLKEDWNTLKQHYNYDFFIQELEHIIIHAEEKIIIMHRFEEFFEFQDRYEIENVYKALIKISITHNKKIIFLLNNKHENHDLLYHIAEEFSDISISITNDQKNNRIVTIKNLLLNQEFPLMKFQITQQAFVFDYYHNNNELLQNKVKNVLLAELNPSHSNDDLIEICSFIFKKQNFDIKYADSMTSMLKEIFIRPDVIVIFMTRSDENFDTIKAIKAQLPETSIIAILDQDFVRSEDIQEAYTYGCDELFSNDLELERLILVLQKASKSTFYTDAVKTLPALNNKVKTLDEMLEFAHECVEKSIFFSIFVFQCKENDVGKYNVSRKNDYICREKDKIFYLALNTAPKDIIHIRKRFHHCELIYIWEPITHTRLEDCLHA